MQMILFMIAEDGTDYSKISIFDWVDQIEVYDRIKDVVTEVKIKDISIFDHLPIIKGIKYTIMRALSASKEGVSEFIRRLKNA